MTRAKRWASTRRRRRPTTRSRRRSATTTRETTGSSARSPACRATPPEEGTVLLLHLASIEFQDAGAIQFRIPEEALAARDWSQICAEGDSA